MLNVKNLLLKKDHYELEHVLECKNCQVIEQDEEYLYIKPLKYSLFSALKESIVTLLNKNPELYCDCKKTIFISDSFEDVIKVKKNNNIVETLDYYDMTLLLYKICFSNKSSYGPMIKCMNVVPLKEETSFLPDSDDYNSDEEINDSIQHYIKINKNKNEFKNKKNKINKSKNEQT